MNTRGSSARARSCASRMASRYVMLILYPHVSRSSASMPVRTNLPYKDQELAHVVLLQPLPQCALRIRCATQPCFVRPPIVLSTAAPRQLSGNLDPEARPSVLDLHNRRRHARRGRKVLTIARRSFGDPCHCGPFELRRQPLLSNPPTLSHQPIVPRSHIPPRALPMPCKQTGDLWVSNKRIGYRPQLIPTATSQPTPGSMLHGTHPSKSLRRRCRLPLRCP